MKQWNGPGVFRDMRLLDDGRMLAGGTDSTSDSAVLVTMTPDGDILDTWFYSSPLGDLDWNSIALSKDCWLLSANGVSDYWGSMVVKVNTDFSVSWVKLLSGGGMNKLLVAFNASADFFIFTNVWDSSWAWSSGPTVLETQVAGSISEPQGNGGEWDGDLATVDAQPYIPEGRIDGYDEYHYFGELLTLKNAPDTG